MRMYQLMKTLINQPCKKVSQIRNANGQIIEDGGSCLKRWAKYFENLLNILNTNEPAELTNFESYNP